jgi:hypothetical protein
MSAYESSIPGASVYGGAALLAKTAYQKSLARLQDLQGTRLNQAGFEGDINAETGVVQNIRASQTNQHGDFQQLNRSQAQGFEGARNQGISRGLGTGGGLAAQLQNEQRYQSGLQDANFGRSLTGDLAGYQDQLTQAAQQRNSALYQAELAAAQAAQQNGDWSPTNYSGMDQTPYGDTTPSAPPVTAGGPPSSKAKPKPIVKAAVGPVVKKLPFKSPSTLLTPAKVNALNKAAGIKPAVKKKK